MTNEQDYPLFTVGDEVEATDWIHRVDNKAGMYPISRGGKAAKVIRSWINPRSGIQIIDIQSGRDFPICSLVVTDRLPLRKCLSKEEKPND